MGRWTSRTAFLAAVMLAATACASDGDQGVVAGWMNSLATATAQQIALFDAAIVHSIEVEFEETDYDAIIETFAETGEKDWIEATVTIDGVTYERAGMRLKGNSSLAGLGGPLGPGGAGGRPGRPAAANAAEETGTRSAAERPMTDGPMSSTEERPGGPGGGFGPAGGATADEPDQLPWLIDLAKFIDQSHDGYEHIVIRSNGSDTAFNEAVALDLLAAAGLASQKAMATSFSVNGSEPTLRLAVEHPDDDAWYERAFDDAPGALYKANSTGDWSYRGDDPEAYDEAFTQKGGKKVADLTPLIEFLQFINEADDATFASELPERLDVDGLATYLAMMELVANFDDIAGPGNNGYLWWDATTEQFTVVPWDFNLAFSGGGGFRGGRPGEGMQPPDGFNPNELPDGVRPPEGFDPRQLPEGFDPDQRPGGAGAGFGGRGNVLVQRFHATAEFDAIFEERLTELRAELYASDIANGILDAWVETLTDFATNLVATGTIATEAAEIRAHFNAQ